MSLINYEVGYCPPKIEITGTGIDINTPLKVFEEVIHHRTEPVNVSISLRSWDYNIMTGTLVDNYSRELSS